MGSSKSSGSSSEVRFAPYLEEAHSQLLDHGGEDIPTSSFIDVFNYTLGASPYGAYDSVDIDLGFFGTGYEIGDFPTLWDMFGKFMAGLDLHTLWSQIYNDLVNGPEVANAVSAQSALSLDDIDSNVLPKFLAGMRDINAVQSSAFIIGKALIMDGHVKAINKFASQIRIAALSLSVDQWGKHLDWNRNVMTVFTDMFKLYYANKQDFDRLNLEYPAKDAMWDINLFEYARAMLGAMAGSAATTSKNEPGMLQKAIGGTMTGAAAGMMVSGGNPAGAVVGGLLGLGASFF